MPALRLVLIGLAGGLFSALFGVGGGVIIVPLLILAACVPERCAAGTSLAAIGITALAGAILYGLEGHLQLGHAALVGLPAAAGAIVGTSIQQRLPVHALSYAFAGLLVLVAARLLLV